MAGRAKTERILWNYRKNVKKMTETRAMLTGIADAQVFRVQVLKANDFNPLNSMSSMNLFENNLYCH